MTRVPVLAGGDVLVQLGDIVRKTGLTRNTARRRLRRLRERDIADGHEVDWFIPGEGPRSADTYNLTRLERAHPALFRKAFVSVDDYEQLLERMDSYEAMLKDEKQRINAAFAQIRELRSKTNAA